MSDKQKDIERRVADLRITAHREGFTDRHPVRWDQLEKVLDMIFLLVQPEKGAEDG